jgi:hypothetical protein
MDGLITVTGLGLIAIIYFKLFKLLEKQLIDFEGGSFPNPA